MSRPKWRNVAAVDQSPIRDLCCCIRERLGVPEDVVLERLFVRTAPLAELADDTVAAALELGRTHDAAAAGLLSVAANLPAALQEQREAMVREAGAMVWGAAPERRTA